jgi:hypothetical protein
LLNGISSSVCISGDAGVVVPWHIPDRQALSRTHDQEAESLSNMEDFHEERPLQASPLQ